MIIPPLKVTESKEVRANHAFAIYRLAGTYAEYIALPEADVALMPANLSFEAAAGVPLTALTAFQVSLSDVAFSSIPLK